MVLATADRRGRPAARFVLLKHADARGFVFFTNGISRKGRDLRANPYAALVFYWNAIGRQVRVAGRVEEVDIDEVDAYWETRPRQSRLAALASKQSAPMENRAALMALYQQLARRYRDRSIPRPPQWTGYRVIPDSIEFWTHHEHRLHDRELFTRTRRGWQRTLLQP